MNKYFNKAKTAIHKALIYKFIRRLNYHFDQPAYNWQRYSVALSRGHVDNAATKIIYYFNIFSIVRVDRTSITSEIIFTDRFSTFFKRIQTKCHRSVKVERLTDAF